MTKKITRRDFLSKAAKGAAALGAAHLWPGCASRKPGKKPNVLMIVVDDLREELGCYGDGQVISPNIDRLASTGLLFTQAHVQQAVCAPSRASFLTGCRPDTTGVDFPYTEWFMNVFLKSHPDMQTYFYKHGYYTTACGKVHHGQRDPNCSEPHYYSPKPKWAGENHRHGGPKPCVEFLDKPDSGYMDGDLTDKALTWLGKASKKKEPFFMAVGYRKPHLPFVCPQKYADLYKREEIELSPVPQYPANTPAYSHRGKRHRDKDGNWVLTGKVAILNKNRYTINPGGLTENYRRELKHGYYACVSFVDAQVGRLMDALKRLDMWDDTIVVLLSDNGYHLGEHNWWTKGNNCDFDTGVPMIFRIPGQKTGGQKTDALVETVDIFPTLLDACGFPVPDYMEGTSFIPLLDNPRRQWKKAAFSQYPRGRRGSRGYKEGYTVRTQNYRYTEWRNNKGKALAREFYDYIKDPLESENLIHKEEYREIIKAHKKLLKAGWKKALPPGVVNKSNNPPGDDSEYLKEIPTPGKRKKKKRVR